MNKYLLIIAVLLIAENVCANEAITALPPVTLTAKLVTQDHTPIEVQRISKKTIAESPVVTFSQLLAQQQSVVRLTNQSGDNSQTALSVRGFGDNAAANSLILIDGFPLTNVSLLAPNLNAIVLSDIENIEIIPGSRGVLWGDQAVGGVVQITTRHPTHRLIEFSGGGGSFQHHLGYLLAAETFKHGIFAKVTALRDNNDQYRQHNHLANSALSLTSGIDYATGSLQLTVSDNRHDIQFPGGLTAYAYHHHPRLATNFKNHATLRNPISELWHQHVFSNDWILAMRFLHQDLWGSGFIFSNFKRREWENWFSPRLSGHFKQHQLTVGGEWLNAYYSLISPQVNEKVSEKQHHLFMHDEINLSKQLAVIVGLRSASDRVLSTEHHVVVSEQGLIVKLKHGLEFYLRRDGNFRFPKANEVTFIPSNVKELKPQTGVSYESGMSYQTLQHQIGFNIYCLNLRHELGFDPTETPATPFGTFRNFDPTRRIGFSVNNAWQITPTMLVRAQINGVHARFLKGPYRHHLIPAVPAITGNVLWQQTWREHWRTQYSVLYTGRRYPSEDFQNESTLLPGYFLQTLSLQYFNHFAEISVEIGNLFNQRYANYVVYTPFLHEKTFYPGTGRYYMLTLKTTFD